MNHRPFRAVLILALAAAGLPALADEPPFGVKLEKLGTYASGVFAEGGAEIGAYDRGSKRLFVVNSASAGPRIDILDLRRPATPVLAGSIDVTPYGASANSVAVHGRTVAVAVQANVKTDPGKVVFFDVKGRFLAQVTVGALPDMLAFSPDGRRVVVCNEGEPSDDYATDPEGSVSVIDLPKGGAKRVTQEHVTNVGFTAFNGQELAASVRVYGPNATAAQDFEPEYAAISRDGRRAWVTLQENNALALIDLDAKQVTSVAGLGFKDHAATTATLRTFDVPAMRVLGSTPGGTQIRLGGCSGLFFEGRDATTGKLRFLTHTDRGPNAEPVDTVGDSAKERPFPLPDFQPRWIRLEADPATGSVEVTGEVGLTRTDGTAMTGVSNLAGTAGLAHADEPPVGPDGQFLALDPLGVDLEGAARADDGTWWMCDEYRPSILHFDADGRLIRRYVPVGSGAATGTEALPAVYAQRRANRGFEGIAINGGKVYAFVQSPLDNPDVANDATSKASRVTRICEFDPATETVTAEYAYVQEVGSDKIGDAVACGPSEFLVIERDDLTGPTANKKVWRISLAGATKLNTTQSAALETTAPADLSAIGVKPVLKTLWVDLATVGYAEVDKPEGLAFIDDRTIALINDNDFALDGTIDTAAQTVGLRASAPTILGIIEIAAQGLDASDRDGGINVRPWPVFGMYEPDAIAALRAGGRDYLLTANEGDTRDWDGFGEESRVKDLTLDPTAFPQASVLRADGNLGRLTVTRTLGDTDGDGDFDALYVPGARSFSVRDAATGGLVWDSGERIERLTGAALPAEFNSNNDENDSFDSRSDNKGPEPEGLAVGAAYGRQYAFVGLERIGGVTTWDVTDPTDPAFVDFANSRDFAGDPQAGTAGDLGPEGVLFIPAGSSPTRRPLVVVTNEISGTTTVYQVVKVRTRPARRR